MSSPAEIISTEMAWAKLLDNQNSYNQAVELLITVETRQVSLVQPVMREVKPIIKPNKILLNL